MAKKKSRSRKVRKNPIIGKKTRKNTARKARKKTARKVRKNPSRSTKRYQTFIKKGRNSWVPIEQSHVTEAAAVSAAKTLANFFRKQVKVVASER